MLKDIFFSDSKKIARLKVLFSQIERKGICVFKISMPQNLGSTF